MTELEEILELRKIIKEVREGGSVQVIDGQTSDQGVAIWNSSNIAIGRVDYELIEGDSYMTNYWWFDPQYGKVFTEHRVLSKDALYEWINNDSEVYYLNSIRPIPVVE
jgi:hypothetical protein